jgi:SIR2-like domain
MTKRDTLPYELIADELMSGTVVPFFGSAASAVYRPAGAPKWEPGQEFFPFGAELAEILARVSSYNDENPAYEAALSDLAAAASATARTVGVGDFKAALDPVLRKHLGGPGLALIASFFAYVKGSRPALERKLRQAFDITAAPGALHRRLAAIEEIKLYATTNYDDLLETALASRRPHVLVDRPDDLLAIRSGVGSLELIARDDPALRLRLTDSQTGKPSAPILFKMHGSIDRTTSKNDSYLITEDDYVDYLGRSQGAYIPPYIYELMEGKGFLFLGYSLEDWNIRVILRKLLKQFRPGDVRCWAIVRGRGDTEQEIWRTKNLDIYSMDLKEFADRLVKQLDRLRPVGGELDQHL